MAARATTRQSPAVPAPDEAGPGDGPRPPALRTASPYTREHPAASPVETAVSEYVIVIDDAGSNFSAHAPDVPGCVATGRTIDETVGNMREALTFHFDGLRADGLV